MNAARSRDQMIADIRRQYPLSRPAIPDPLETVEASELETLHATLPTLAAREDLQPRPTQSTIKRRKAATDGFTEALARLKALRRPPAQSSEAALPLDLHRTVGLPVAIHGEEARSETIRSPRRPASQSKARATLDGALRTWREERMTWIDATAVENFERHLAAVLFDQLSMGNLSRAKTERVVQTILDAETQIAVRLLYESTHVEVARLLRNRIVHHLPTSHQSAAEQKVIERFAKRTLGAIFEPVILPEAHSVLSLPHTLEGLVKLQAYAADFAADVIYVPDAGSQMVGEFLAVEMKARGQPEASLWRKGRATPPIFKFSAPRRILFVADVAERADAFKVFRDRVRKDYGEAQVRFAVLLGSSRLYDDAAESQDALITHVAPDGGYTPPWDRSGGYARQDGSHVFGARSDNPLTIPDEFVDPSSFLDELSVES